METKITESTSPNYNGPTEKITIDYRVSEHMKRIAKPQAASVKLQA
jgi:hypothetical protein